MIDCPAWHYSGRSRPILADLKAARGCATSFTISIGTCAY